MTRILLVLLFALPILSQEQHDPVIPFRLFTVSSSKASAAVMEAVKSELGLIMSPTGWPVEWTPVENALGKMAVRVTVARLRGRCGPEGMERRQERQLTLGATSVGDGKILPFVDIYCDAIRTAMAWSLNRMEPREREPAFGRAMARVLAHELYHVLGEETQHGASGIAQRNLTCEDLAAPAFRFDNAEVRTLRRKLAPVLLSLFPQLTPRKKEFSVFVASGCITCHSPVGEATQWGPALRSAGRGLDAVALQAQLNDAQSPMCKQAKSLKVALPKLNLDGVQSLVRFLKTLAN